MVPNQAHGCLSLVKAFDESLSLVLQVPKSRSVTSPSSSTGWGEGGHTARGMSPHPGGAQGLVGSQHPTEAPACPT